MSVAINIYRASGVWYGARWVDGGYDGCDELDVPCGASEDDAMREAMSMPLTVTGDRVVRRVSDVR